MKFVGNIGLLLMSATAAMSLFSSRTVMALDDESNSGNDGLEFLRRELGSRCKDNGKHCEIKFLKAKYEPGHYYDDGHDYEYDDDYYHDDHYYGDGKCILKYKFVDDDSSETYELIFKEKHGAKIKVKDGKVKCILEHYDGSESGDGDGLPPKLVFHTQEHIPAKYDGEKTKAKVEGWKKHDDLVLVIYEPDHEHEHYKCSFNNAKHCDVKFKKATYEVDDHEEVCTLKYKLKNSYNPDKVYKVIFKKKYGAKIKVKHDKVKCIYKDYYGQDFGHGWGLPYDLEFHKMHIHDAYYKGHDTNGRVESWKKGKDLILVIKKPDSLSHSMDDHDDHHDEHDDDHDDDHGDDHDDEHHDEPTDKPV